MKKEPNHKQEWEKSLNISERFPYLTDEQAEHLLVEFKFQRNFLLALIRKEVKSKILKSLDRVEEVTGYKKAEDLVRFVKGYDLALIDINSYLEKL